jgi:uncharacterized protein YciI
MQFVIYCTDKPASLDLRMATRAAHLEYIDNTQIKIVLAGPLLGADGGMQGSMFVVDADSLDAAKNFSAGDPYRKAGLFERVEIHGFRTVFPR